MITKNFHKNPHFSIEVTGGSMSEHEKIKDYVEGKLYNMDLNYFVAENEDEEEEVFSKNAEADKIIDNLGIQYMKENNWYKIDDSIMISVLF